MCNWNPFTSLGHIALFRPVLLCIGGDTITMAMRNEHGELHHAMDSDGSVHSDFVNKKISDTWHGSITHWCYVEFPKGSAH